MKAKKVKAVEPTYTDTITVTIGGEDKALNYRKSLPLEDYAKLVTGVAYQVVNDETGYSPFVYDVALKKGIIESFSDFKTPADLNGFYDSGEMDMVYKALVSEVNINNAIAEIDKLIEFKRMQLANKSEIDNLCKTATEVLLRFEKKFGNQINPKAINAAVEKLGAMQLTEKGFIDALVDKIPKEEKAEDKAEGKVIPMPL